MEYQFSFSKSRLILLCAATFFTGLLLFIGGVVTGIGLWKPLGGKTIATTQKGNIDPAAKIASAKSALKIPEMPGAKQATPPATSTTQEPTPVAAVPETPPAKAASATPEVVQAAKPNEPASPPAVAVAASASMPDMTGQPFVLQLGAFREQKNAKVLQTSLKERGYAAAILNMVDEDQRTWHMVRLGGYKDLSAASKAASDFTGKEGIQALVRRSDSL